MINKTFLSIIAVLVLGWASVSIFGITGGLFATILAITVIVQAMRLTGIGAEFVSGIPIIGQFNPKVQLYALVIGVIALVFIGAIALPASIGAMWSGVSIPTGEITPDITTPVAGVSVLSCIDKARALNPDNVGKAATIPVNAYDQESNTPYSAAVDINPVDFYRNGNDAINHVVTTTDTTAYSLTGLNVGDTIYVYGGSATYNLDSIEGMCITTVGFPLSMSGHAIATESDMEAKLYADSGSNNELSSGTASEDDYTVALGANAEEDFYLKLKVNTANKAFQLGGIATAKFHNITSVEVISSNFNKIATPKYLEGISVLVNESSSATISEDYTVYKRTTPLMLHEWESIEVKIVVETDPTNDPVDAGGSTNANNFAIIAVDSAWSRGDAGISELDIYQHDSAEGNVGLVETVASPLGGQVGVMVQVS